MNNSPTSGKPPLPRWPWTEGEIVTVTFPSAHQDVEVRHRLSPGNPEDLVVIPVKWVCVGPPPDAPIVYVDGGRARKPWGPGVAYLRSTVGGITGELLLLTKRT